MKTLSAAIAALALGIAFSNASAKQHGGSTSSNSVSASRPSATTSLAPHFNGAPPIYSGGMPYRPVVRYANGTRTLNYPPVGISTVRHQIHSSTNNFNNAYAIQRGSNLHQSGNLQQASTLNVGGKNRLEPQTSNRLRNWNGNVSSVSQAHLNHLNNCNHHHDSWWWHHRCVAIIFFDFGWWGWDDGWWYPAWGYDPYSHYEYNEPIYGYDGLSPDQIVAGVQAALQQRGYYTWAIDGKMGPLRVADVARFQRDHGLPITSGIDPATLGSLGVIR